MNYKSKLLSVFLSAGILLNSTSMAFAGQDSVNAKSGDQHTESTENGHFFEAVPQKTVKTVEIPRVGESIIFTFHNLTSLKLPEGLRSKRDSVESKKFHTKVNDPKWEYRDGWLVMEGTEFSAEQGKDEEEGKIDYVYYEKTKTLWIYGYGCNMKSYAPYDQGRPIWDKHKDRPIWEKYIDRVDIEHLVLEDVSGIGAFAFHSYYSLKTVKFPDELKLIGGHAFSANENLTTVDIPSTVETIEEDAFAYCGLTSITLPKRFESRIGLILGNTMKNKNLKINYTVVKHKMLAQ